MSSTLPTQVERYNKNGCDGLRFNEELEPKMEIILSIPKTIVYLNP